MPTVYVETLEDFTCKQKGCEYLDFNRSSLGGTVFERLFRNGATARHSDAGGLLFTQSAPTDMFAITRAELDFLEQKLQREADEWQRVCSELNRQADLAARSLHARPISDAALDEVEAGKFRIYEIYQQMKACKDVLAQSPEAIAKREQEEQDRQVLRRRQEQLERLAGIMNTNQISTKTTLGE